MRRIKVCGTRSAAEHVPRAFLGVLDSSPFFYSCIHIRFDTEAMYSPALQQWKATAMDEPPTPPTIAAWRS